MQPLSERERESPVLHMDWGLVAARTGRDASAMRRSAKAFVSLLCDECCANAPKATFDFWVAVLQALMSRRIDELAAREHAGCMAVLARAHAEFEQRHAREHEAHSIQQGAGGPRPNPARSGS